MQDTGKPGALAPMDEAAFEWLASQAAEAARLLKLFGNERRLLIACLLLAHGELSVSALMAELRLSQSALSQHLALLREAGIVRFRRSSQTLHYKIDDPKAVELIGLLKRLYCEDLI